MQGVFEKCLNHFPATYLTTPRNKAATGHSIPRRLESPTSQAIQLPELELTLTPATRREHSQEINNLSVPAIILQAPGPSRKRSISPSSSFLPDVITFSDGKPASETSELNPEDVTARLEDLEVEIDTLHADTEDKELLISELQDSLAAAENEIAILQMRVADTEGRHILSFIGIPYSQLLSTTVLSFGTLP
ncbi:hypothetical protein Tco_0156748 [Tanacetum coccineum]